ncbi:ATP-binding protein [Haloimpatiens sp. FM7330]|uniref:ATP-binding protein n=1 Tax=Haloimpatiens sp. FM7330 TaxID=3298610 RepID=UPI00363EB229
MKNQSLIKLYVSIGIVYFLLLVCFITIIFLYSANLIICGAAIVFSLLCLLICIIFIVLIRKKLIAFSESLSSCIDDMVAGKNNVNFDLESETLMGKFNYKLKRLYEILQRTSNQTKEEKQAIQEMISDISHQVKTPVANLKMYNSTLLEQQLPPQKEREFHELMETQINKLDFLMQSMVKMSRLETGIITLSVQPASLYDTIALALGSIVLPAEKKNIKITVKCDPYLMVPHDKKWTAEALFNILDNAVKYTSRGGKITLSVERWEMVTKIDIADTGKGIPEKHLAQIFKRFYREEDVHNIDGVGIGLYLCRKIISKQSGYIQVKSQVNRGSIFSVFFPNER